jgi:sugar phosphate isomerase/epimerase
LLENVNGANAETSAESARLLAAVRSPAFGLAWDPNNAYCGRETPFPDGYRTLDRTRILHVHLRDAGWDADGKRCRWLPVGKGQVDNLGLLRALAKDGFSGTLTLETHYSRPDGNKELATRESLQGLLPLLDKV